MKNQKKYKKFILFLFLLNFFCNSFFCEEINFSALKMSGSSSKNSSVRLSGKAFVQTKTMEITADEIEISGTDYDFINASGNVSGKNLESKMEFSSDRLEFSRSTNVALLRGNVSMTDVENDVSVSAQLIEYNQNTEVAVIQINVNLKQKDNICTGENAVYSKKNQLLDLSGNAQIKQNTDTFRAQSITLNLETEEITLDGNVKGSVQDKNESEETQNQEIQNDENSVENPENENSQNQDESNVLQSEKINEEVLNSQNSQNSTEDAQ